MLFQFYIVHGLYIKFLQKTHWRLISLMYRKIVQSDLKKIAR